MRIALSCIAVFAFGFILPGSPQSQRPQAAATASIEGIVVGLGTTQPVAGADVELTRLEGAPNAPLSPGAFEAYVFLKDNPASVGAAPPAALKSEVQYAKTGDRGEFVFRNLKPGGYRLVAVHTNGAYYPAEYGQRNPGGRGLIFPVLEGETKKNVNLEMAATGAISGRVQDADGEPMTHAAVLALQYIWEIEGRRSLRIVRGVTTNERGEYRLFWLTPGTYFVAVKTVDPKRNNVTVYVGNPGRYRGSAAAEAPVVTRQILPNGETIEEAYALVYYGGVLDPEKSQPIDVKPGATFGGADVFMGVGKMRAHHVRGVLTNAVTGQPVPGIEIRAVPLQPSASLIVPRGFTDDQGAFDLNGALPGRYALVTPSFASRSTAGTSSPSVSAYSVLDVANSDVENFRLLASPPLVVSGRVSIEGRASGGDDADLARIRVRFNRDPDLLAMQNLASPTPVSVTIGLTAANGVVNGAGTLTVQTTPGDYQVSVTGLPPNTYVKSIRAGSDDILSGGLHIVENFGSPLEIVIGTDSGEVVGTAVSNRAEPMSNVVVVLVPELRDMRRHDRAFSAATDAAGRFQLGNIPAGDYKIFAWDYVDPGTWLDPSFMQDYEGSGKSLRIVKGTRHETQVTVIPVRP